MAAVPRMNGVRDSHMMSWITKKCETGRDPPGNQRILDTLMSYIIYTLIIHYYTTYIARMTKIDT